jgi:fructose-bisphosphate aldolase, class I
MEDQSNELQETINKIAVKGKGILAADESTPTCTKRFNSINVECTEENRKNYREMLFSTPNLSDHVSGVILFEETLKQTTKAGTPIPNLLHDKGIVPGIKVDRGLIDLNENEKITQGLEDLPERLKEYKKFNPKFAKWRAVYTISDSTPSDNAINENAQRLAKYAKICQDHELVPIVEPEILLDGNHTIERCAEVSEKVFKQVFAALQEHNVAPEHIILKPSMVVSGKDNTNRADVNTVAEKTVATLKASIPPSVPTINFLSGGQTPEEATQHLQAMNKTPDLPWLLSFSYGRALQEPALLAWKGKEENKDSVQRSLLKRAKLNGLAAKGEYSPDME